MLNAYVLALTSVSKGHIVACIPGEIDHQPAVAVPEFFPTPLGIQAAVHPDANVRARFLAGVIAGLHRACELDESDDFVPVGCGEPA